MNPLLVFDTVTRKFDEEIAETKRVSESMKNFSDDDCVGKALGKAKTIIDCECGKLQFLSQCIELINEYSLLLKKPISLGNKDCSVSTRKNEIVGEFKVLVSEIARSKKWNLTELINEQNSDEKADEFCLTCGEESRFEIINGRRICIVCSSEMQTLETGNTHLDYNRVTIVGKFIYNRVLHFQDCIKQFQGKQNCKIPPKVLEDLDKKFLDYRLLEDSDIRQVRYGKITKQHIKIFLQELKYIKHYENVNIIYSMLTSNRIDDIGHLEKQLIDDFKELVTLYDKLHSKDKPEELSRKNFLNVQYLLFQLLRRHGYDCKIEDFAILKTPERKLFHDTICCNLFKKLQWNFTPTF